MQGFLLALHEAASARGVQDAYLRTVDDVVPARGHGIYFLDERRRPALVRTRGVSDGFLDRYEAEGRPIDPLLGHLRERHRAIRSSAWRTPAWRAHPFYEVIASGGLHHILQAPLVLGGELVGTLNVARTPGDRPFTAAEQACAEVVAGHVSLALRNAVAYEELDRRRTLLERMLDLLRVPLLATSLDGTVLFRNRAAEELLDAHAATAEPLALARALRRSREQLRRGRRRVVTTVLPAGPAAGTVAVRSTLVGGRVEAIVSFLHETPAAAPLRPAVLSPREQEIVELVARGLTNREIAEVASISRNTVKQHLKRVFGKVQVGSRTELATALARAQSADGPFRPGAQDYPAG